MQDRRNAIVAGTGFSNEDGSSRAQYVRRYVRNGMPVKLVREPRNEHDEHAVAVFIRVPRWVVLRRDVQIGYIKRAAAIPISRIMDAGGPVQAWVDSYWAPDDVEFPRVSLRVEY